jgi:hypothetical protein
MSATFSKTKHSFIIFSMFRVTLRSVSGSVQATVFNSVFQFLQARGLFEQSIEKQTRWYRKYTLFATAELLRNRRKKGPSNKGGGGLDECHGGSRQSLFHEGGTAYDLICVQ